MKPIHRPGERCTVGHDQLVLNEIFHESRWRPLDWRPVRASQKEAPGSNFSAVHFYSSSAPWSQQCARCVAAGLVCSRRRAEDQIHHHLLPAILRAQQLWWREAVHHIPDAAKNFIGGLLEDDDAVRWC